jgi:hypothetical protein
VRPSDTIGGILATKKADGVRRTREQIATIYSIGAGSKPDTLNVGTQVPAPQTESLCKYHAHGP